MRTYYTRARETGIMRCLIVATTVYKHTHAILTPSTFQPRAYYAIALSPDRDNMVHNNARRVNRKTFIIFLFFSHVYTVHTGEELFRKYDSRLSVYVMVLNAFNAREK